MRPIPKIAVDFVAKAEAIRLTAYQDSVGVWTIGAGHTGGVKPGDKITRAQALEYLAHDLQIAAERLSGVIGPVVNELTENQYAALLSFVFNLGANPKWTIWKVLKARKFDQVPGQMMRFVNAGGKRLQGLVNRRTAEVALWNRDGGEKAPPSSVTRSIPTPPTPTAEAKPIVQSKTLWTGAATAASGAAVGVTQVQQLVAPQAYNSEFLGKIAGALAVVIVALGVGVMMFRWLDERARRR